MSESGTVALESNRVLLAGGVDGKIRVLDASLRTNQVERVLEACNVSEPSDAYLRVSRCLICRQAIVGVALDSPADCLY